MLVASSFTCQFGVFAAERGDVFGLRRWYLLTLVMGTFFVLGQANEYHNLVARGDDHPLQRLRHGLLPGDRLPRPARHRRAHRVHLPADPHQAQQVHPAQATAAIVVSYYWHFVDVVWIGLFAVIYFIR